VEVLYTLAADVLRRLEGRARFLMVLEVSDPTANEVSLFLFIRPGVTLSLSLPKHAPDVSVRSLVTRLELLVSQVDSLHLWFLFMKRPLLVVPTLSVFT